MRALLVIDMQNGVYSWEGTTVHAGVPLLATVNSLISRARVAAAPVVLVQHADEWLIPGTELFALLRGLDVDSGDLSVTKRRGSAFDGTPLQEMLRDAGVDGVVVCGLQTEFCVDSTVRHAVTLGVPVTLVSDAHSTYDSDILTGSQIVAHHNRTLGSYVDVLPAGEIEF
ncbi:MAG TPA: cysteine hydrolase family protein [Coriobacteriia bacterium]|nr:cysteine hydrolase family protein [Coriobacteriia bacterium]